MQNDPTIWVVGEDKGGEKNRRKSSDNGEKMGTRGRGNNHE